MSRVDLVTTMTFIVLFLSIYFTFSNPVLSFAHSWAIWLTLLATTAAVVIFRMTFLKFVRPIIANHYERLAGPSVDPLFSDWLEILGRTFDDMKQNEHESLRAAGKRLVAILAICFLISLGTLILVLVFPQFISTTLEIQIYYQFFVLSISLVLLFFILIFLVGDFLPAGTTERVEPEEDDSAGE